MSVIPAPTAINPTAVKKVALFATCLNDLMWPGTPIAVVKLLRRLGCDVDFPREQTCCGQPFTNTGYAPEAEPAVRAFVRASAPSTAATIPASEPPDSTSM